jgi:hypothetical protein
MNKGDWVYAVGYEPHAAKVELVIATDKWNQQDLIDFVWQGFTNQDELGLVENIVYEVDGTEYENEV